MKNTTAIILAGGRNKRLGQNKALLKIDGQPLIERVIDRLKLLDCDIMLVTASDTPPLPVPGDIMVVNDRYPGTGPLGGIFSGLFASETDLNVLVACDMPFLNTELIEIMLQVAAGYDAVVPRLENGMVEPLHSIYSRHCLDKMRERLENGQLGISPFLKTVNVRYLEHSEFSSIDPDMLSFFNINYPEDLEQARKIAVEERQQQPS